MIKNDEQIEIPLSKIKMTMLFISSLSIFIIGLLLVISEPAYINYSSRYSWIMRPVPRFLTGMILIVFFGFIAVFICRKLFDKRPGLIINQKGIIDNSGGISIGLVSWSDIEEINVLTINNQKLIMLVLKNPQEYLSKVKSKIMRKVMEINYKWYGAPISISANSLKTNTKDLHRLLTEKMTEYKENL